MGTAQHGHAADAASRRQDRGFFEGWERPERFPDLLVAAPLMPNPFGSCGNVVDTPFCVSIRGDSRTPVVPVSSVLVRVLPVWYDRSWCCTSVVPVWYDRSLCWRLVVQA